MRSSTTCAYNRDARIGELVGHGDITTTCRVYTHVVADEGELDYAEVLHEADSTPPRGFAIESRMVGWGIAAVSSRAVGLSGVRAPRGLPLADRLRWLG